MTIDYNKVIKKLKNKNNELYNKNEFSFETYKYLDESFQELENPESIKNINLFKDGQNLTNREIANKYSIYGDDAKKNFGKQTLNTSSLSLLRLKDITQKYLVLNLNKSDNSKKLGYISEQDFFNDTNKQESSIIKIERINNSNQFYLRFIIDNTNNNYLTIDINDKIIVGIKTNTSVWKFVKYNDYYYLQSIGKPKFVFDNSFNALIGKMETGKWTIEPVVTNEYEFNRFSQTDNEMRKKINDFKCLNIKKQEVNNQILKNLIDLEILSSINLDNKKLKPVFESFQVDKDFVIIQEDKDILIDQIKSINSEIQKINNDISTFQSNINKLRIEKDNIDCPRYMKYRFFGFKPSDCENYKIKRQKYFIEKIEKIGKQIDKFTPRLKELRENRKKIEEKLSREVIPNFNKLLELERKLDKGLVPIESFQNENSDLELSDKENKENKKQEYLYKKYRTYQILKKKLNTVYDKIHEKKISQQKEKYNENIKKLLNNISNLEKTIESFTDCKNVVLDKPINEKLKEFRKELKGIKDVKNNQFTTNYNLNKKVMVDNKMKNSEINQLDEKNELLKRNKHIMKENLVIIKSNNYYLDLKTKSIKLSYYVLLLISLGLIFLVIKNIYIKYMN